MYSGPKIFSSFSVNSLCLREISVACPKNAVMYLDSTSVVARVLPSSASLFKLHVCFS